MSDYSSKSTPYDLEERTYEFALHVRQLLKQRAWQRVSWTDVTQLLRSSGSVASNYGEAQEAVSGGDFIHRIRICRKETCESALWMRLLGDTNDLNRSELTEMDRLIEETVELTRIFTSIIKKRERAID